MPDSVSAARLPFVDLATAIAHQQGQFGDPNYLDETLAIVTRYCVERHPGLLAAFIVGSYATDTFRPGSDIDLYVVHATPLMPLREQVIVDHRLIQACILSQDVLLNLMYTDARSGSMSVLGSFLAVRHLCGREEVSALVCDTARRLHANGPPPVAPVRLSRQRLAVINNLHKLMRTVDADASIGCAMKLVRSAITYAQMAAGAWVYDEFLAHRNEPCAVAYRGIVRSFSQFCAGDRAALYRCIEDLLAQSEPLTWSTDKSGPLPLL